MKKNIQNRKMRPIIYIFLYLSVPILIFTSTLANAGSAVCISDIDHYYNIAVQQFNQGDYLSADKNFYVWYVGSYCRTDISKDFLDQFRVELSILDSIVLNSVDIGKSRVLSTFQSSGGSISGKGDSGSPSGNSGKRMPYFPPNLTRR